MALINETTNLKSLRYGKDRLGGGSSNQPYIKSNIPDGENGLGRKGGPDFLLRGGLLTPGRALNDVSRLTQMFFDFKSPNGLLFTAKQNILSRSAVATNGEDGKALNEGIYLPTSTLLQAAGNPFGIHLNKQGLDPTKRTGPNAGQNGLFNLLGITDPLGLPVYTELVQKDSDSRLTRYLTTKYLDNNATELYSYNGGPGSTLGVGRTSIPIYKERTNVAPNYDQKFITIGENIEQGPEGEEFTIVSYNPSKYTNLRPKYSTEQQSQVDSLKYKWGATGKYFSLVEDPSQDWVIDLGLNNRGESIYPNSVYKPGTLDSTNLVDRGNTLTQQQIIDKTSSKFTPKIGEDFRIKAGDTTLSLDYTRPEQRLEQRVNLGDPGNKQGRSNIYQIGKGTPSDKINAFQIYKSNNVTGDITKNDLVKFRIGVIDNNDPSLKTYIHFRAFLDSMNDSYSSDWQTQKFMGRGENFYRYNGFDRSLNLSWTVAAQSKQELIPMYQKLNYLASVCAPDYSSTGYMRGNLITLTVGGYLYEQVGIMRGITYDVPTESPWEIAIPATEASTNASNTSGISSDGSVKELPHIIKVTGFQFIPIHNFVPRVQQNTFTNNVTGSASQIITTSGDLTKFGPEKYIALNNGFTYQGLKDNYDPNYVLNQRNING